MAPPLVLVVDDEPDLVELVTLTLSRMQLATLFRGRRRRREEAAQGPALRSVPDRHALAGRRRPRPARMDDSALPAACPAPSSPRTATSSPRCARSSSARSISCRSRSTSASCARIVSTRAQARRSRGDAGASTRTSAQLIGSGPSMDRLREMILRVSRSQAPVHISGESGTGKELVARMIHGSGPRAEGPFVPVNCGAIPSRAHGERILRPQARQFHGRGGRQGRA